MKENRDAWIGLLFSDDIEGGWLDRNLKDDPGGKTNRGVTIGCYSDYLGRPATDQELRAITAEKAREIAIAMYWNPVNADKLPDGIDIYAADFAWHSGWPQAGRVLQRLVGVEIDGFVGDKTLTAVRAQKPIDLLESYHLARLAFLEGLANWEANSNGWRKRCRLMHSLASSKVKPSQAVAEVAGSAIIKTNTVAAAGSVGTFAWALAEYGPAVLHWLGEQADDPRTLERMQDGVTYLAAPEHTSILAGILMLVSAVVFGTSSFTVWRRYRMWRKGRV